MFHSAFHIVKNVVIRCGDMIFFHQIFRKDLAAFNFRRWGAGAEGADSRLLQPVDHAHGQRVVWDDCRQINLFVPGKFDDALYIRSLYWDADCVLSNAAVARRGIDFRNTRVFF